MACKDGSDIFLVEEQRESREDVLRASREEAFPWISQPQKSKDECFFFPKIAAQLHVPEGREHTHHQASQWRQRPQHTTQGRQRKLFAHRNQGQIVQTSRPWTPTAQGKGCLAPDSAGGIPWLDPLGPAFRGMQNAGILWLCRLSPRFQKKY